MSKVRTRFAPSPTGRMHVGNLRTALYTYLIAKHEGGEFILRIEDTDQERFFDEALEIIYRTLDKTGLKHDEGPDKDGGFGPYIQSERCKSGLYMKYAKELIDKGEAYYCFCDKDGDISQPNEELDDMILIKSDGYPTYNFANVIDDHLMRITHVVRGNEYLSSAPKYTRLYKAFGWEEPKYIHCPLITNEEHQKLSKRSGHSSYEDLIEQGFLSEAVVNYVALLGWSPTDNREIFSLEELVENFDYHHISKSPAVFDIVKLKWMNGEYIKAMDDETYYEHALPVIREVITKDYDLKKIADLVKTRIEIFPDIKEKIDFFEELPEYDIAMYTHKKMKTNSENSLVVLKDMLARLEKLEDYSHEGIEAVCKEYISEKEIKNGICLWPLRTAVSGKQMTPGGAYEIIEIIGKDETIARIKKGIELLEAAQ